MGVNHGGFDIFVAEKFFDGANFVAVFGGDGWQSYVEGYDSQLV